jgi:hypothetical protein
MKDFKQLPFDIESIKIVNTGFEDFYVEEIDWIDEKRIGVTNKEQCVQEDSFGGTCLAYVNEFDWHFKEKETSYEAYVVITLNKQ